MWPQAETVSAASLCGLHSLLLPPVGPRGNGVDFQGSVSVSVVFLWLVEAHAPCSQLPPLDRKPRAAALQQYVEEALATSCPCPGCGRESMSLEEEMVRETLTS